MEELRNCDICGVPICYFKGDDCYPIDNFCEYMRFECGHNFCPCCLPENSMDKLKKDYADNYDKAIVEDIDNFKLVSKKYCPVCNFEAVAKKHIELYKTALCQKTDDEIANILLSQFQNLEHLKSYLLESLPRRKVKLIEN